MENEIGKMPKPKKHRLISLLREMRRDRAGFASLVILLVLVCLAVGAGLFFDYQTDALGQDLLNRNQGPSLEHWLGTDAFGRDLFARIVYGSRYSLLFGIGCTAISMLAGSLLGCAAAYWGGLFDSLLMRFLDALMCIPSMLLMLLMVAVFGTGLTGMVVAIIVSSIPGFTRVVRSVVLGIVKQDYIEAARVAGTSDFAIILRHVIPNASGMILVNGMMSVSGTIMAAAGLSYIGMGIQPPTPEWGNMLSESMNYIRLYPHIALFPGIAMMITSLCFNLLGDSLSDALDPRRSAGAGN